MTALGVDTRLRGTHAFMVALIGWEVAGTAVLVVG